MNHHSATHHTFDVDTRLLTAGTVLTASGSVIALTGVTLAASAVFSAMRKMVRDMNVPPSQMAAAKLRQARHASQAGLAAWHEAADGRSVQRT